MVEDTPPVTNMGRDDCGDIGRFVQIVRVKRNERIGVTKE